MNPEEPCQRPLDPIWRQVLQTSTDAASYPRAQLSWHTYDKAFGTSENVESWQAVVFQHEEATTLHLAMHDPGDVCTRDTIARWIIEHHGFQPQWRIYQAEIDDIRAFTMLEQTSSDITLSDSALLEQILRNGVMQGASDIHLQPQDGNDLIRFRVNGELNTYSAIAKKESLTIINRLKVLSNLHLTETRRPQSGRFSYGNVDIRTAFQSTILGESVALRLLPRQRAIMPLTELGLTDEQLAALRTMMACEYGLLVCCGATGAGKTTTLYALLNELDPLERNIMTLEDPVEYPMTSIRQTEIKPGVMDFAEGVRALLRHDPDVILIGEIRDADTAQMAMRAAMTGHLVMTTLHTHDVWSIPARLADLGVSPNLIAGHMLGAIHQRLTPHLTLGRALMAEVLTLTPPLQHAISQNIWGAPLKAHGKTLSNYD